MKLPSYPKVHNVGHPMISKIFEGPVLVQEKVDGSQISFGVIDGKLCIRSKNVDISDSSDGMFKPAIDAIKGTEGLPSGFIFRGEFLGKEKHNSLTYNRVPKKHICLFDLSTADGQHYSKYPAVIDAASKFGFDVVPAFYYGEVKDLEQIKDMLNKESFLGGPNIEGLVFKNYEQFGRDDKPMFGKHVSEAFKEVNKKDWKSRHPSGKDVVQKLKEAFRTEARWEKAYQHLRDDGKLESSPVDIGPLIKAVQEDIREEEEDFIKGALYKWAIGAILRSSTAGLPEWYKNKLMENAVNGD